MSDSEFSSVLFRLRDRATGLVDHLLSLRWQLGGVAVVALIGAGLWGLTDAGKTVSPASASSGYVSRSSSTTSPGNATATTDVPAQVVVYATGAVNAPGLYTLAPNARVGDVINAAGGLSPDADPDRLNLAAKVSDGQRVFVARRGQPVPDAGGSSSTNSAGTTFGPVNINDATTQELDALPGVGPSTASAIVQYRTAHGPFRTVGDLAKVKGIGPSKLAQLKDLVTV